MSKSLMISIRPKHAINILNGKKTLELRTWIPKDYVGWVYVYVTKGIGKTKYHHLYNLTKYNNGKTLFSITHHNKHSLVPNGFLNSKVVFRFWFDEYEEYNDYSGCTNNENGYECENEYMYHLCKLPNKMKELCLTCDEIETYGNGKTLYAWHVKKLEIFDEPKSLSEFIVGLNYLGDIIPPTYKKLTKAPQKMQWVYAKELENEPTSEI